MAIGALFPAGDSAMAIGPAVMVVYIIMGAIGPSGVGKALPSFLMPFRELSPMNHACRALCAAEFRNTNIDTSSSSSTAVPLLTKLNYLRKVLFLWIFQLNSRNSSAASPSGNKVLAIRGINKFLFLTLLL